MPKTSILVISADKTPLPDGRIVDAVNVNLQNSAVYTWTTVSNPGDDHSPIINRLAAGLANRDAVLAPIEALRGQSVTAGSTTATITDAGIKICGPANWPTYLAWQYDNGDRYDVQFEADDPLKSPHPADLLKHVTDHVTKRDTAYAAAKVAATFPDVVSDPNPLA
jgi:hypothetical protein